MLPVPHNTFSMSTASGAMQFVRPADPESILDSMTDEEYEKDKMLPYWAELWPASFGLFNFLAAKWRDVLPERGLLCELGSGLGIVSALLAANNVRCIATDISFDACRFSQHNILLHARCASVVCTDWRQPAFKRSFDCVVASDIIYEARWVEPVLRFLYDELVAGGTALIADPCRQWWQLFKDSARAAGFLETLVWEDFANNGKTRVEVLKLRRRGD
jgi:ETFB lysine methyltransferase